MKVLFVIVDLYGGAGVYTKLLATGLKRFAPQPIETELLLFRNPPISEEDAKTFDRITKLNLPVHGDWRRTYETVRDVRKLGDALDASPADITVSVGTYANLLVPYAAPDRLTILTEHVHLSGRLAESKSRVVLPRLIKWRYPGKTIVVPSQAAADDLRDNFDLPDVRVIPHGIDADRVHRLAEETPADLPAKPYFIAVGRLVPQKDFPTLLTAFAEAHGRGLGADLLIVGSGAQLPALQELAAKLGVTEQVRFLGQLENPYPYIKHAKALVLSSVYEGFGLVLLEAMTLGTPTISTDCPAGPAEILADGKYGKLLPPRDPNAMANALLELMSFPEQLRELSEAGITRAAELSLQRMTEQYVSLFDEKTTASSPNPV